jgi:hypothetical protein
MTPTIEALELFPHKKEIQQQYKLSGSKGYLGPRLYCCTPSMERKEGFFSNLNMTHTESNAIVKTLI